MFSGCHDSAVILVVSCILFVLNVCSSNYHFISADEQEVATTESPKEETTAGHETQCGGSWHG